MSSSLLLAADRRETQSRADRDLQAELIFEWPPKSLPELWQQRGVQPETADSDSWGDRVRGW